MPKAYDNVWQGNTKRVLTVCSANMLRSPTIAHVLSAEPFNYNTRSCGTYDFALIPITRELLDWADEIVCADTEHAEKVIKYLHLYRIKDKPVVNLRIPDHYEYRNPELIQRIIDTYKYSITYDVQEP